MSRQQRLAPWQERNAVLAEMGCSFRLRLTSQSPIYYVRAVEAFPDGTLIKSSGIHADDLDALNRAFRFCLELEETPSLIERKTSKIGSAEELTGWTALTLRLKEHLTRRGTSIHTDYARHIRELQAFRGGVSAEAVKRWVLRAPFDSRERLRRVTTARRLFEIGVGIDRDWLDRTRAESTFNGDKILDPRDLPTDEQVVGFIDSLHDGPWKTAMGLIATYGLRNHEVFRLESRPDAKGWIEIAANSKTGYRPVMPAHPEWIERWRLRSGDITEFVPESTHRELGSKVSTFFSRWKHLAQWSSPSSYDLRHAYAARLHTHKAYSHVRTEDAAQLMGHGVDVHKKTYLKWCKKEDLKRRMQERLKQEEEIPDYRQKASKCEAKQTRPATQSP